MYVFLILAIFNGCGPSNQANRGCAVIEAGSYQKWTLVGKNTCGLDQGISAPVTVQIRDSEMPYGAAWYRYPAVSQCTDHVEVYYSDRTAVGFQTTYPHWFRFEGTTTQANGCVANITEWYALSETK